MTRALNFNAGPAALPEAVLQEAQKHLLNFNGTGMSVMELSHRSKEYEEVHAGAQQQLRKLLTISEEYEVLLLQGGASLQFSMIPLNLLKEGKIGYYVLTGSWSEKALKEAKKVGSTAIIASSKEEQYRSIPSLKTEPLDEDGAYLHITSNNTIYGTEWKSYPSSSIPLIADMSSDILSKRINVEQFGLIYAGAQKNLGPSGVTVVIMKKDLITTPDDHLPTMLSYETYSKNQSLYNTPPTFSIYLLKLVLDWVEHEGGIEALEKRNQEKAKILYDVIDESDRFYSGHAIPDSRSNMNVTFTLPSEEKTKEFLNLAEEKGFVGLNGHRSVGGCRASIYNAVPVDHVVQLAEFMKWFKARS
ncbi:3-phosphoserine/phosphohydroxythreonine transaminase [Robertmurraya sp. DFI.2.37]|uniref:3-phosphoserine/phosphohydroxythreonine transaminase n=2 Tax=Bacillati TaxID=1783272 RepID=UPI0012476163|nr:3-phosphoserine/phosphohydroxythreonine transaminase [Robertmurraya sp. DFI.2.37]MDF1511205.1 3-phosphoserine/phosphohydroxythreonine transaminase [Robertmurraya sp. DFI.2.37]